MNKTPPQAIDVEEKILGSMLFDKKSVDIAFEHLIPSDFYKPVHEKIYVAMMDLHMQGEPIDLVTVEEKVKDNGFELDNVTLPDLTRDTGSSGNVNTYCNIVKNKSIKRTLIEIMRKSLDECFSNADAFDMIDKIQERIFSVTDFQEGHLHDINDTLQTLSKHITELQERGESTGLKTGLDIDEILQGFQDGKLYILGARPSMGKTALVMTCMRELARSNHKTGILSLETTHRSLGFRLLAQVSNLPVERLTSGRMTDEQQKKVSDAMAELSSHGIYIDDSPSVTAQQLRAKCRMMVSKGVEIIFIDFLTLIKTDGRSKHEEVGEVMKVSKMLAKELHIPVVMLAQLSRKVEDRGDKIPMLSDLRESGSIEEDADAIMFLYRPEYYGINPDREGKPTDGIAQVIIAKNKDGRTGVKNLFFEKETMTFKNLTEKAPF